MAAAAAVAVVADSHTGQCLCGAVTFRAQGLRDIWFCHCRQCRKVTGHFLAACRTEKDRVDLEGELNWLPHSGSSELGRCADCGSPMLWRQQGSPTVSVIAGSLDDTHGLAPRGHIFTAETGDYYTIGDDLPQWAAHPEGGC